MANSFQIKDFTSITASMVNWMRLTTKKVTDFVPGSVARTTLESVAADIEQLYQQLFNGLLQAIPVSVYQSFSFPAQGAVATSFLIRVTVTTSASPILVAGGTSFSNLQAALTYSSAADITIPAGNTYVDVPVTASAAGALGNIPVNTAFTPSPLPVNFVSAINLAAGQNGSDAENSTGQLLRFQQFIQALAKSPVLGVTNGLLTTQLFDASGNVIEQVKYAVVLEPYETDTTQPVGLITCFVHNGVGATSSALVAHALQVVNGYIDANGNPIIGYKAAGTHATVAACTEQTIAVTGTVYALPGYTSATLAPLVETAISTYLIGIAPTTTGSKAELAQIYATVMAIPGVANFVLTAPTTDTSAVASYKLMPGAITITPG